MAMLRLLLLALLPALAACATARGSDSQPVRYVIRHFDTVAGERDPQLLPRGIARAERLATMLGPERIAAIYVSDFARTRQSAAPLAARLGLTPIVYDPADTAGLLARVRAGPSPALVVGHSNTVPDIVAGLGGTRPADLVHDDFGDLWRIERDGTTTRLLIDVP